MIWGKRFVACHSGVINVNSWCKERVLALPTTTNIKNIPIVGKNSVASYR